MNNTRAIAVSRLTIDSIFIAVILFLMYLVLYYVVIDTPEHWYHYGGVATVFVVIFGVIYVYVSLKENR